MKGVKIAVLCGGVSSEREISLVSGGCVAEALGGFFDARLVRLDKNEVPEFLNADEWAVFPAMHGEYGEDGTLQRELDLRAIEYAGSGELSSRLCMVKPAAKALMKSAGLPVAGELLFDAANKPDARAVFGALGQNVILKPADKGSSVGLMLPRSEEELGACLEKISEGMWLAEEFFKGRELSVGLIDGRAAGIVEIKPQDGIYDFERKYTAGKTVYEFPAKLSGKAGDKIRSAAEEAYKICGCRDFARVDFIIDNSEESFIILEINTLPGMTPTSLLPKSASCLGIGFEELCRRLITPAVERMKKR